MAGFEADAVVQIFEGDKALGSGYDLGNGRVLTARHVVEHRDAIGNVIGERSRVSVRCEGQLEGPVMIVVWRGAGEVDVAVLCKVSDDGLVRSPPTVWLFDGDARGRDWFARGFPAALGDAAEPVEGKVAAGQGTKVTSPRLLVEAPPPEAKDWMGMSGAAVFVGDRLFGVIGTVSRLFQGARLSAVPIVGLLMTDETLRAAVGLPTLDERRAVLEATIKALLHGHPEVGSRLSAAVPRWAPLATDFAGLAAAILDGRSAVDLVIGFRKAMHGLLGAGRRIEVARAMRELLEHALPFVVGSCSGGHGQVGPHELPTEYPQIADAHEAWANRRRMRMLPPKQLKGDYPLPEGYVEIYSKAVPEDGMGHEGRVEAVAEDIATRSQRLAKDWYAREGNADLFEHQSWARKLSSINAQMKAMEDLTFFALARAADRPAEQEFLALLAKKLDAVRIIVPRVAEEDEQADDALLHNLGQFYRYYYDVVGIGS